MNYETMDWEAEAKRVAAAFGVEGECEFKEAFTDKLILTAAGHFFCTIARGLILVVSYNTRSGIRSFALKNLSGDPDGMLNIGRLSLNFDGTVAQAPNNRTHVLPLAKGLFYLDLLTPEVEAELGGVSAHQKLEWTLEFEARFKLTIPL